VRRPESPTKCLPGVLPLFAARRTRLHLRQDRIKPLLSVRLRVNLVENCGDSHVVVSFNVRRESSLVELTAAHAEPLGQLIDLRMKLRDELASASHPGASACAPREFAVR